MLNRKIPAAMLAALTTCALLFCGCTSMEPPPDAANTPALAADTQEESSASEIDAEFYLGETVFIGDSRTNGLLTYQLLPPEQVFAIDGSTQKSIRERNFIQLEPGGRLLSLKEAVEQRQPHRLLIAFGVNAIPVMSEEEFMKEYDLLVDELVKASPDSQIVLQSILPVAWWKHESMPYLTNENIDHFNALLADYAEQNGYLFFDISDHFKGEDGSLSSAYDGGDGLHFNQSFYHEYISLLVSEHP